MATYSTGLPAQYKGTATLYEDLLGQSSGLLDYFGSLKGTSTGLSPEVLAGLNTQAMETIPNDFRTIESDLTTSLARRGGGLPMGGEFLRTYAPLQAAKEQQKSNLLRDTLLADQAERRRTGDLNNANALAAAGQAGSLGANLQGQATQADQFSKNLDFTGTQNDANRALTEAENEKNRQLQLKLAEIENAPASMKSMLWASLISTGSSGLLGALSSGGGLDGSGSSGLIGDLGKALGIGGPAAATAAVIPGAAAPAATATVPGVVAPAATSSTLSTLATYVPAVAAFAFAAAGVYQLVKLVGYTSNDIADIWTPIQSKFEPALAGVLNHPSMSPQAKLEAVDALWAQLNKAADDFTSTEGITRAAAGGGPIAQGAQNYKPENDPRLQVIRQMHQTLDPLIAKIRASLGAA